jgi:histone H3/H4
MNNYSLQRLAYKAGAVRVSSTVYDELRYIGGNYIKILVRTSITYADYEKRKTVSGDHMKHAVEQIGTSFLFAPGKILPCKTPTKKRLVNKIKELQAQTDCFTLSKLPIIKMIKESYRDNIRWSEDALNIAQLALEHILIKILHAGLKITLNSERKTLMDSDVKLAIDLMKENCTGEKYNTIF